RARTADDGDAVISASFGVDSHRLGEGAPLVQAELDWAGPHREVHVTAEALTDGEALVCIELLARADVLYSEQQNELIELAGCGCGVFLLRRGDVPDSPIGRLDGTADAPEGLLHRLEDG